MSIENHQGTESLRSYLLEVLGKRNLFDAEFADEMAAIIKTAERPTLMIAASAVGEALAVQADAVANAMDKLGAKVDAGRLRSKARLAHAEWRPHETEEL